MSQSDVEAAAREVLDQLATHPDGVRHQVLGEILVSVLAGALYDSEPGGADTFAAALNYQLEARAAARGGPLWQLVRISIPRLEPPGPRRSVH